MTSLLRSPLRTLRGATIAGSVLAALAVCAPPEPPPVPPSDAPGAVTDDSRAATPLAASLQVELLGDSLHLVLQVTNTSPDVVPLTFRTGQSADFVVMQAERELWRWSAEQMFTQAIRRESLAPGETRSFEASWRPPHDLRGTVTARGFLTADEHSAEQQTEVRLP